MGDRSSNAYWMKHSSQEIRNLGSGIEVFVPAPLYGAEVNAMLHALRSNHRVNMVLLRTRTSQTRRSMAVKREKNLIFTAVTIRTLDIFCALLAIIALFPLIVLIFWLIALTDTPHVLFRHRRVGTGGKPFYCLKFRTMAINSDEILVNLLLNVPDAKVEWERDRKLRNDPRITKLGMFLRKSSLDELPQFWNVLRGEMSIVGPRPIVMDEAIFYGRHFKTYCSLKPGITGLWQVSGRNDASYRRRVAMDVKYSKCVSVSMYVWIIAKTIPAVVQSRGVY